MPCGSTPWRSGGAGCLQGVVLLRTQVVRQGPVLAAVHPVGDLIHAGEVVGAGDDGVQPHLRGEGIPPVEGLEHDVGIVGDAGQHIVKKSADYNSTNGLPAGTLLEGAVFEIYDKAGNLVVSLQ